MPSPKPEDVKLPDGYFIEALVASDYEETLELLGNIFSTNNPAAVALGIPAEVCVKCSRIDLPPEKICNGLSLVIKSKSGNNEIVAFALMKPFDILQPPPSQEMLESHFSTPILVRLVEKIYESSIKPGKLGLGSVMKGKSLHLAMGGTATELGGQGLAKCIRIAAVKHAKKKGFNSLLVEAGHPATGHIWNKYVHARKLVEIDMNNHVDSVIGGKPWEGKNVGNMILYEYRIEDKFCDSKLAFYYYLLKLLHSDASRGKN